MSTTIPKSWRATKLKFVGRVVAGGTPDSGNPDYWDGSIPWLTPVDLGNERNDAIRTSKRLLTEEGVKSAGLERLPVGSVVVSTRAPIGSIGLLECEAVTNQGCKALVPDTRALDSRFAFYLALDSSEMFQSLGLGTTFAELSTYAMKNLAAAIPSLSHQRRISAYLNDATAKIDRLMALRRRQIELLKEQRAALIQQAVTRGLDPYVKLKPSGLPWLGSIPRHWEVKRLRHVVESIMNGTTADQIEGNSETIPVTRIETISTGQINYERVGFVRYDASLESYRLRSGDILFSHINSISMIGNCAVFDGTRELFGGMNLLRIRPLHLRWSPWLIQWLKTQVLQDFFSSIAKPAINQASIPIYFLKETPVVLPPQAECEQILTRIDQENAKVEALLSAYTRQLEMLAEYRASLIHECVTGQREVG